MSQELWTKTKNICQHAIGDTSPSVFSHLHPSCRNHCWEFEFYSVHSKYLHTYTLSSINTWQMNTDIRTWHVSKDFMLPDHPILASVYPLSQLNSWERNCWSTEGFLWQCSQGRACHDRTEPHRVTSLSLFLQARLWPQSQPGYLRFPWKPCNFFNVFFYCVCMILQAVSLLITLISTHKCSQQAHIWVGGVASIHVSLGMLSCLVFFLSMTYPAFPSPQDSL